MKNIKKSYGENDPVISDLNLQIKDSSFTVLLGPSGCGKSTILRMIAGLENESSGEIHISGRCVKNVAPGDRHIAMVFQNYALYPTMSIRENIEFGLRNLKIPKKIREEKIAYAAGILGITEYLERKPQNLSGGQRQRVALARAIVKEPDVFLMDEPLSNLDAKLRNQIRTELIELYRNLNSTFLYVTHDQVEAMSMATDIILLNKGKIQQQGTPEEIYKKPANIFTAKFIGSPPMNVLGIDKLRDKGIDIPKNAKYFGFRPENSSLKSPECKPEQDEIDFQGEVITHEMLGDQTIYKIKTEEATVYAKMFQGNLVDYGSTKLIISRENIHYFDENEMRIGG